MVRNSLDQYDERPKAMVNYLKYYGWNFNKKMLEFAVSMMYKDGKKLQAITKDKVEELLNKYNITLKNDMLYNSTYVANMAKADFYGSSIVDEQHMAKYIKDVIDDEDAYDGIVFNRWYADMCKKGVPIDWEEMI